MGWGKIMAVSYKGVFDDLVQSGLSRIFLICYLFFFFQFQNQWLQYAHFICEEIVAKV